MPFFTTTRAAVLLLLFETIGAVCAQSSGSPYSAYGFGDLLPAGQTPQALKGGTGLALSEPFSLSFGNPANYAALARPVFDVGFNASTVKSTTDISTASRGSADLTGFSVGVPFGGGKWGIGLGLTPYSNVDYSTSTTVPTADGDVPFNYSGSGGLDRAFFGVGRSLLPQQYDWLGNASALTLAFVVKSSTFSSGTWNKRATPSIPPSTDSTIRAPSPAWCCERPPPTLA